MPSKPVHRDNNVRLASLLHKTHITENVLRKSQHCLTVFQCKRIESHTCMINALYRLIQKASFSLQLKWIGFTLAGCSTSILHSKRKTVLINSSFSSPFLFFLFIRNINLVSSEKEAEKVGQPIHQNLSQLNKAQDVQMAGNSLTPKTTQKLST